MGRVFNTEWCDFEDPPTDPHDTTFYDGDDNLIYIGRTVYNSWGTSELVPQWDTMCIYVDGACAYNGYPNARASVGVYFGPDSAYNWAGILDRNTHPQTSQYAEIFAAIRALRIYRASRSEGYRGWDAVETVVVVTDSDYVFRAITDYVYKWEGNNYMNSRGVPVVNGRGFRQLNRIVKDLESEGIAVLFWKVPREYNQEANALAGNEL